MRSLFFLFGLLFGGIASAQIVPNAVRYEGPVVSIPTEVRFAWRVAANRDGDRVAVCCGHWNEAGEVRIFDLQSGKSLYRFESTLGVRGLTALPDGLHFASGDFSGNLVIRRFADGEIVSQWKVPQGSVEMMDFSADGSDCFFGSNGDFVARADAKTGDVKAVYAGHTDNVYDVAVSPDGKTLVSSAADGVVMVWDVESTRLLHKLSHPGQVAAVHWLGDSIRFASVASDGRLCVWDATSGELADEVDTGGSLYSVEFDSDKDMIITGGRNNIQLWNAKTLEPIELPAAVNPFQGHGSLVFGVHAFGENELLTAGWDKQVFLWDRETGARLVAYEFADDLHPAVTALAGNRDLTGAIVARADGTVAQINTSNLQTIAKWSMPGGKPVVDFDIDDQSSLIVAGGDRSIYRQTVRFDVADLPAPPVKIGELEEQPIAIAHVRSPDNAKREIAAVAGSGKVMRLAFDSGELKQTIDLPGPITAATWIGDQPSLFTQDDSGALTKYSLDIDSSGSWSINKANSIFLPQQDNSHLHQVGEDRIALELGANTGLLIDAASMAFLTQLPRTDSAQTAIVGSADGRSLLIGTKSGGLSLYRSTVPTIAPTAQTTLPITELRFLSFSSDASTIRVGSIKADFVTLKTDDLSMIDEIQRMPPFGMASSTRSNDRKRIAVTSWSGEILVSLPETEEILAQLPPEVIKNTGSVGAVAFSSDGSLVAGGSKDGVVRLYKVDPPELLWQSEPLGEPINGLSLSADGKYVAASTGDYRRYQEPGLTALFNVADGTTEHVWKDSTQKVTGVAFSPDSTKLVACGNDALRTYDVKSKEVLSTANDQRGCQRVRFVDQSRCIVTLYPGNIILWDTRSHRLVARFTGHNRPAGAEREPMIWALDLSDDGKQLVTGDVLGQTCLWAIP